MYWSSSVDENMNSSALGRCELPAGASVSTSAAPVAASVPVPPPPSSPSAVGSAVAPKGVGNWQLTTAQQPGPRAVSSDATTRLTGPLT